MNTQEMPMIDIIDPIVRGLGFVIGGAMICIMWVALFLGTKGFFEWFFGDEGK